MGIESYFTTPAANTGLFPEGQLPGTLNDGVRQLQADLRAFYNDAEWIAFGDGDGPATVTFVASDQFRIEDADVAAEYHAGRRVRVQGGAVGTLFGTITAGTFDGSDTTVTVAFDGGGQMQNEPLAVAVGVLRATGWSLPDDVARRGAVNVFLGDQVLRNLLDGPGADPTLHLQRFSPTPAAFDNIGRVAYDGHNSNAEDVQYAAAFAQITDPTPGAEAGRYGINTLIGGATGDRFWFGSGFYAETLDDPGFGRIAALEEVRVVGLFDDAIIGPDLALERRSDSPAANDFLGRVRLQGYSTAPGDLVQYGAIFGQIVDPTDGAEEGRIGLNTLIDGSTGDRFWIGRGLYAEGLVDQGFGTGHFSAVYDNGVLLSCYVLEAATTGGVDLPFWDGLAPGADLHGPARAFDPALLDPARYAAFWRAHGHLPALPSKEDWADSGPLGVGDLVQRLWETVEVQAVHIAALDENRAVQAAHADALARRIAALEARAPARDGGD